MPRSAPLRFGVSAATVRPGMRSACATISPASANCGRSLGGTNEQTSISGMPASASAVHHAFLASVGMISCTLCSPSRMPTSRTQTSILPLISRSFQNHARFSSEIWVARSTSATSPPLERGLALLVEGADALVAVLGPDQPVIGLDLEHEAVLQIHLQPVMDRLFGLADRERRVGADRRLRLER